MDLIVLENRINSNSMKNYILIFCIFFNVVYTKALDSNNEPKYIPAYDFSLYMFQDSDKDSIIKLSSLKGNVVLLNFWATWCGPCIAEVPEFNKLYHKYNSKKFEILGISINDSKKQLERFASKVDIAYPILYSSIEEVNVVIQNYGGFYSIPVSFLINREGLVVRGYPGAILGEYWTSMLHDDIIKFLSDPLPPATKSDIRSQSKE